MSISAQIRPPTVHPFADTPSFEEMQRRYIGYILKKTGGKVAVSNGHFQLTEIILDGRFIGAKKDKRQGNYIGDTSAAKYACIDMHPGLRALPLDPYSEWNWLDEAQAGDVHANLPACFKAVRAC